MSASAPHFLLRLTKADKLLSLQMRRLFTSVEFHPSIDPVSCGSFWCNRPTLDLNISVCVPLTSFSPLKLSELKIRILFRDTTTITSPPIAFAKISLPSGFFNLTFPSLSVIDQPKGNVIGSISVNIAVLEGPGQYSPVKTLKFGHKDGVDWKTEARQHNWRSVAYVRQNWEEFALHFGWTAPRKREFGVTKGNRITMEIGYPRDVLDWAMVPRSEEVCLMASLACSVGPQKITPYAMRQMLRLDEDFEEKRRREYHSERGFRGLGRLVDVRARKAGKLRPSTFDPREQLDALMSQPLAPRFSIESQVLFDFPGFRPSIPDKIAAVEAFDVIGQPPILMIPSIEQIIGAGEAHLVFTFSDSTDEDSP
jgi:hypothetical protein